MNKIFLLFLTFFVFADSDATTANTGKNKIGKTGNRYIVKQWNVVEISLTSSKIYTDPFNQAEVTSTFSGPDGKIIIRPAFWDGGTTWKIRFAPTVTGMWDMVTSCSDTDNAGLHAIAKSVKCTPYSGGLDIYKHGFLKVSGNKRYFVYDDGTPFFYLGDTHWLYIHEHFNSSNVKGIASQFKYVVDKRVAQGFTVYQTEAIQHPHGQHSSPGEEAYCNFRDGFDEKDIAGFNNIDHRFTYIADKGLVNANSAICWALDPAEFPDSYSEEYMNKLGRYWAARYGAYPVLWTIAQEIDKNMYNKYNRLTIKKWFALAEGIADNDAYHHPLTAHMENTGSTVASTSWWAGKLYHQWWAIQWQGDMTDVKTAKDFWFHSPVKPSILYESPYEGFWTDERGARETAYKAFQYGIYGYGYGANGVWNDLYSKDPPDYGTDYEMPVRFISWYDGANLRGAGQLIYFKKFYSLLEWWKLLPRFDDTTWCSFADKNQSFTSTDEQQTYVIYFSNRVRATGDLKNLEKNKLYTAKWYNTRTGVYTMIKTFKTSNGTWTVPGKPDSNDWILLVKKL